jgi:uncharacterized OB-fold protein
MTTVETVPIAEDLFTGSAAAPRLLGGHCTECGGWHFPVQANCPHCAGLNVERTPLRPRGTLWTWTIQTFAPPSPPYRGPAGDEFVPFGVGYIELPEGLSVQARLTVNDGARLAIGMPMALTLEPFGVDEQGRPVTGYAFAPMAD